jgi:hypothetical protein
LTGFQSLISLDGIANSNQVNGKVTFDEHREQTELSLIDFNFDKKTQQTLVQHSWHLLQLSVQHSLTQAHWSELDLFLLLIARESPTKRGTFLLCTLPIRENYSHETNSLLLCPGYAQINQ